MKNKNRYITSMEKLTQGYEDFIKGKELDKEGIKNFKKAISAATITKKQRGLK